MKYILNKISYHPQYISPRFEIIACLDAYEKKEIKNINDAEKYFQKRELLFGYSATCNKECNEDTDELEMEVYFFITVDRDMMYEAHNPEFDTIETE